MESTIPAAEQNKQKAESYFKEISPQRKAQLLDNALGMIGDLFEGEEQYNMLRFSLGLTEEEIKLLGFDQRPIEGRNTTHWRMLFVPAQMLAVIDGYLHAKSEDEYQREDAIIRYSVKFSDAIEVDIKCCGCRNEASYAEAVLFCYGSEEAHSEAGDTFAKVWELSHNGDTYIVEVVGV